jgi:hypothetical protein
MSKDSKQRLVIVLAIIFSAIIMRLVPHIPNFAPVTAAALFGAVYLPKRYALFVPLMIVAISDYLLLYVNPFGPQIFNFSQIQPLSAMVNGTTAWVWGSFMVSALLGLALRKKQGAMRISAVSVVASLQFFIVTNFGVWAAGAYSRDLSGLAASYIAGLPFLSWTLMGDMFYAASFFGLYALALRQSNKQLVQPSVARG